MRHRKWKLTKQQKERLKTIGKWGGLGLLTYETFMLMIHQRQHVRDVFNLALQRQNFKHKPLLVVGNPSGSLLNKVLGDDFDCADLCIDPKGCPSCTNVIAQPVDAALGTLGNSSYVVFVSPGTLEHVPDMVATLNELQRVSGGDLFIAHKSPWTVLSLFGKRRVLSAPPQGDYTEWRDLPWMPGPSIVQRQQLSGLSDTMSLGPLALALGAAGAFIGYQIGKHKALPALAGAAAGTATAAIVVQSRRQAALSAGA